MKTKLTRDQIKALIRTGATWLVLLIVWRVVTMLVWSIFFGSTVQDEADHDVGTKTSAAVTIFTSAHLSRRAARTDFRLYGILSDIFLRT